MIRRMLRGDGSKYIPILFDFDKLEDQDYTEVITVLAGIAKFIIADLTSPSSIAQELHAIMGAFRTPVIPIIENSNRYNNEPFSMFEDFYKYGWVHPVIEYSSKEVLAQCFNDLVTRAEEFGTKVFSDRRPKMQRISIEKLQETNK
ncbi:MAG: hypothetical protein M3342_22165 [Bacteroidota bacterium]|nr:hypothetical protein [Bacteroidota bacterium]